MDVWKVYWWTEKNCKTHKAESNNKWSMNSGLLLEMALTASNNKKEVKWDFFFCCITQSQKSKKLEQINKCIAMVRHTTI